MRVITTRRSTVRRCRERRMPRSSRSAGRVIRRSRQPAVDPGQACRHWRTCPRHATPVWHRKGSYCLVDVRGVVCAGASGKAPARTARTVRRGVGGVTRRCQRPGRSGGQRKRDDGEREAGRDDGPPMRRSAVGVWVAVGDAMAEAGVEIWRGGLWATCEPRGARESHVFATGVDCTERLHSHGDERGSEQKTAATPAPPAADSGASSRRRRAACRSPGGWA